MTEVMFTTLAFAYEGAYFTLSDWLYPGLAPSKAPCCDQRIQKENNAEEEQRRKAAAAYLHKVCHPACWPSPREEEAGRGPTLPDPTLS